MPEIGHPVPITWKGRILALDLNQMRALQIVDQKLDEIFVLRL